MLEWEKRKKKGGRRAGVEVGIGADFLEPSPTCPLTTCHWSDQPRLSDAADDAIRAAGREKEQGKEGLKRRTGQWRVQEMRGRKVQKSTSKERRRAKEGDKGERDQQKGGMAKGERGRERERAESLALRRRFSVCTRCREANNSVIHS